MTARLSTAIRFDPELHEALRETAEELTVSVNWLVTKLCEEGLARIDLTNFSLVRRVGETAGWHDEALARKHQDHYRSCGCLGDFAECCIPSCECHAPQDSAR